MPVITEKAADALALPDLRVDVAALRRRGIDRHHVSVELPIAWLARVLADTDAEPSDPGHVDLDLQLPVDGPVIVTGSLRAHFDVPCGRCLDPARVVADTRLAATYVPAASVPKPIGAGASAPNEPRRGVIRNDEDDEEGLGLSADDLDTWTYEDTTVDLATMVVEYVKVAYPMRALCTRGEACRGLCSNCGAALNEQAAGPRCAACGHELAPEAGGAGPASDAAEGPLAAALRKLRLPE